MKVSFAAAGTAGHVEPALAVAKALVELRPDYICEFIGSSAALESNLIAQSDGKAFFKHAITKAAFPRTLGLSSLLWPIKFTRSLIEVNRALKGSSLVVGFGGYVCAPSYLIAKLRGIPMLIHEANVKPGMANNLGLRLGAKTVCGFAGTSKVDKRWSNSAVVGIPLREQIRIASALSKEERELIRSSRCAEWGFEANRPIVLVFGGSQGSREINQAIADLLPTSKIAGIQIVHSVGGENELPASSQNYYPLRYIQDMASAILACDLVISRAGAMTVAELGALHKYALLVPLELGNGEQRFNAGELVTLHAASVVAKGELSGRFLSEKLIALLKEARTFNEGSDNSLFPLFPLFPLDAHEVMAEQIISWLEPHA